MASSSSSSSSSKKRSSPSAIKDDFNAHFDAHVPTKLSDYDFRPDVVDYSQVPEEDRDRVLVIWKRFKTNEQGEINDVYVNIVTARRAVAATEKMVKAGPNERDPYMVSVRVPLHYAAVGSFPKFNHFGNWATAAAAAGQTLHKGHEDEFKKAKREARYTLGSTGGTATTEDGLWNAAAKADADLLEEWQERFFQAIPKHPKLKKLLRQKQEAKAKTVIEEEVEYLNRNKHLAGPQLLARLPLLSKMAKMPRERIKKDPKLRELYSEQVQSALGKLRFSLVKEDEESGEYYLNMRSSIGREIPDKIPKDRHGSLRAPEGIAPEQADLIPNGCQLRCPPMLQYVEGTDNAWQPLPHSQYFLRRGDIVSPVIELSVSVTSLYVGFVVKTTGINIFKRVQYVRENPVEMAVNAMGGTIMSEAEVAALAAAREGTVEGGNFGGDGNDDEEDDDMDVDDDQLVSEPSKKKAKKSGN
jgi:hypothetical protein